MWKNIELIKNIIHNSYGKSEILRKLGLKNNGGNFNTLSNFILRNKIDISHFVPYKSKIYSKCISLEEVLLENSTYSSFNLKRKLYKEGIKERKCELCNQEEIWRGKKMSLILDHKNGDRHDNRLENLRIVCPNCNATLETHCRGLRHNKEKYDHCSCGGKKRIESKKCFECCKKPISIISKDKIVRSKQDTRKVERPSYEILLSEVKEIGYSATGRKYKVSDNSIRKWIKMYEKYGIDW